MLTFTKWYQEWLINCDYVPDEKQRDAMEDAWNGALVTVFTPIDDKTECPETLHHIMADLGVLNCIICRKDLQ